MQQQASRQKGTSRLIYKCVQIYRAPFLYLPGAPKSLNPPLHRNIFCHTQAILNNVCLFHHNVWQSASGLSFNLSPTFMRFLYDSAINTIRSSTVTYVCTMCHIYSTPPFCVKHFYCMVGHHVLIWPCASVFLSFFSHALKQRLIMMPQKAAERMLTLSLSLSLSVWTVCWWGLDPTLLNEVSVGLRDISCW